MDRCIPMEALGTLDALSPEDPVRRHANECARCSTALAAYNEFLLADAPRGADVDDADRRLAAFITERIEGVEKPREPRVVRFPVPVMRWAVAAAIVITGVTLIARQMDRSDRVVLRGDERSALNVHAPRALADGSLELGWNAVPEADSYQVILLADDLMEVARMIPTTELRATLNRSSVPAEATRWQVAALREGAVMVESTPEDLP